MLFTKHLLSTLVVLCISSIAVLGQSSEPDPELSASVENPKPTSFISVPLSTTTQSAEITTSDTSFALETSTDLPMASDSAPTSDVSTTETTAVESSTAEPTSMNPSITTMSSTTDALITTTETSSATATAINPGSSGPTCSQSCLLLIANNRGCGGITDDLTCICKDVNTYLEGAQSCMLESQCDITEGRDALNNVRAACDMFTEASASVSSSASITLSSTASISALAPTPTPTPNFTSSTRLPTPIQTTPRTSSIPARSTTFLTVTEIVTLTSGQIITGQSTFTLRTAVATTRIATVAAQDTPGGSGQGLNGGITTKGGTGAVGAVMGVAGVLIGALLLL